MRPNVPGASERHADCEQKSAASPEHNQSRNSSKVPTTPDGPRKEAGLAAARLARVRLARLCRRNLVRVRPAPVWRRTVSAIPRTPQVFTGIAECLRILSTPSRNVLFCQVEMSYRRFSGNLPFPSCCTVLHRGQPSRLPFGARIGGLDGTRPRCGGITVMRGMAGLFWREFVRFTVRSTSEVRRTFLLGADKIVHAVDTLQTRLYNR